jgi:hypothetical protein
LASPPTARSDDELFIKASWLAQLTGNRTAIRFPNLKLVNHFNYLKKVRYLPFLLVLGSATDSLSLRIPFSSLSLLSSLLPLFPLSFLLLPFTSPFPPSLPLAHALSSLFFLPLLHCRATALPKSSPTSACSAATQRSRAGFGRTSVIRRRMRRVTRVEEDA